MAKAGCPWLSPPLAPRRCIAASALARRAGASRAAVPGLIRPLSGESARQKSSVALKTKYAPRLRALFYVLVRALNRTLGANHVTGD